MKTLTYTNINALFTFENVSSNIIKFWLNEVIKPTNTKIWLTVTVTNSNKNTFILIKNLPFNTSDYSDVLIVLNQIFSYKLLSDRIDYIDNITFTYSFEKQSKYNWQKLYFKILKYLVIIAILIYSAITIYLIYIDITQVISSEHIGEDLLAKVCERYNSLESITNNSNPASKEREKKCVFDIFIKLFDPKKTKYFPSYFAHTPYKPQEEAFNLLEYIIYNHYVILEYNTNDMNEYIRNLNDIILQYQTMTNNVIQQLR